MLEQCKSLETKVKKKHV